MRTNASVASAVLSFLAAVAILLSSPVEHLKSVKPSTLLITYLLFSIILDLAQARTLFLLGEKVIAALFSAIMGTKLLLLWIESWEKRAYLKGSFRFLPPESTSNIISKSIFWWLNPVFVKGYKSFLSPGDLESLPPERDSEPLEKSLQASWDARGSDNKSEYKEEKYS